MLMPCLGGGYVFDAMVHPQPGFVVERVQATFDTDAGTAEDNDLLPFKVSRHGRAPLRMANPPEKS